MFGAYPDFDLLPPCHSKVIYSKELSLNQIPFLRPKPEDVGGTTNPN